MEKEKENSSSDEETEENGQLEEKNILPQKIFSSHSNTSTLENDENVLPEDIFSSHPKASNPENDKRTESKPSSKDESKHSQKADDKEVDEKKTALEKPHVSLDDSVIKPMIKASRFEDDIIVELKREFPNTKTARRVHYEDEDEPVDPDGGYKAKRDDGKPKPRDRSKALDPDAKLELPDMSSEDIIVEKRGPYGRKSIIGEEGFVADLLLDVISHDTTGLLLKQTESKPICRQDSHERRATVMAIGTDIASHFKNRSPSKSRFSSMTRDARSKSIASGAVKRDPEFAVSPTTKSKTLPPELKHLKSGWEPKPEAEDAPIVGLRQRKQSWVGLYVDGTDYWGKKDPTAEEEEEVAFEIDKQGQTWYDLPVSGAVQFTTETKRTLSQAKLDTLKMMASQETIKDTNEDSKRLFSFDDRAPLPEKISSDLYQMFLEFCKADDLAAVQNRLSLVNADRSLEKVGLLDHKKLTMIHTGFCFKAAGGSRYRGLTFTQYRLFIEMVAETRKMPVFDFVNRLKLGYAGIVVLPTDK